MRILMFSLIIICVLKRIESDDYQDLVHLATQLQKQLADEYVLAHAAAESAGDSIKDMDWSFLVHNKVSQTAHAYEEAVIAAQSEVDNYLKVLQQKGQGDPTEFKALKRSVLHNIKVVRTEYAQAMEARDRLKQDRQDRGQVQLAVDKPWYYHAYKKRYIAGAAVRNALAATGLYALGNAFLGWWNGSGDVSGSFISTAHPFGSIIKFERPKFSFASGPLSTNSDTTRIVWIASLSIVVLALLFGGWILWNRYYRENEEEDHDQDYANHRPSANNRNRNRKK